MINTVTRSGTDQFHGDAYFYDRSSAWASTNPFTTLTTQTSPGVFVTNPYKPTDIRKIWGGDLGGYIIKDKLFFYIAYDNYGRNFPGTAVAANPTAFFAAPTTATINTLATRLGVTSAQALVDYNNGLTGLLTMLGPVPRTGNQNITFPKIDWVINDKNRFSAVANRMRWSSPAGIQTQSSNTFGIASFGNDYVQDTWVAAKLNSLFTTNVSNEFRYQWGRDNEFENSQTPTPYEQSSLGRHLPNFVDTNLTTTPTSITYTVIDPNHQGPVQTPTLTGLLFNSRPNPNFGAMTDIFSGVNSLYNAFVVQVNHNMMHNVQFSANYTWAHALDYGQNESTFTDTNDLLNPNCLQCEYGSSNFDVRHRFAASAVVDSWWHVKGWQGYLANGWQLAPIFAAQTGLPYSLATSGSAPGGASGSINGSGGATRLFETGRNTYRYPNTYVLDLRLSRNIKITEKVNLQVLGEAFNLANHVNVTGINNTGYLIGTCAKGSTNCVAGTPTLTYNSPFGVVNNANSNFAYSTRQIQIGAKVSF